MDVRKRQKEFKQKVNTYILGRVKGRRQFIFAVIQYLHPFILSSTLTYIANFGIGNLDL